MVGMLTKGVVLLHDNARPHTAARTNTLIKLFNCEIFDHPSYSSGLAPSDYHPFTKMRVCLVVVTLNNKQTNIYQLCFELFQFIPYLNSFG
jgi:histone-lysine N-methyltransferase SETMAR